MVFGLRSGDLCLCFDWWWHLLVFWWMTFCQNGWLMGFIPRNANIYQTSNGWASSPTNVYFTIQDFIMGCYLFSGLINGLFAPSVAWLIRFAPSVAWLVSFFPLVAGLMGFYPFCGLDCWVVSPSVAWLLGRIVGTKGVSHNHRLSFDDNKVLKIVNWIC